MVVDEGRALVIGVNKWDACRDREARLAAIRARLERSLPQTRGLPVVTLSALQGRNVEELVKAVLSAYEGWKSRVRSEERRVGKECVCTRRSRGFPVHQQNKNKQ